MDPVLVLIISPIHECIHCEALMNIWHKVTDSLLSAYPKLKFPVSTIDTKQYKYPPIILKDKKVPSIYPKDLNNYCYLWTPMTILVPGQSWHKCLANPDAKLENIQIMNSKIANGIYQPVPTWNTRVAENFGLWLKESLKAPITFFPHIIDKIKEHKIIVEDTEYHQNNDICNHVLNIISRH